MEAEVALQCVKCALSTMVLFAYQKYNSQTIFIGTPVGIVIFDIYLFGMVRCTGGQSPV